MSSDTGVSTVNQEKKFILGKGAEKNPQNMDFFQNGLNPFEKWTFWKQFLIFFLNRISQSESQNLRLVNFVPYKLIFLTVLTTF